ncbi:GNAT family N-acetyltransferase [Paenibacillus sp. LMG 31459]|uniref:GNAT family N-acetyltransferase n=1 Tax=Paenibacillus phytohabitans TaxID=2654978 RepID=A0ABX1YIY8_9BACL|nr:GNAT family N-acetyltransferase [Paenibacillus phytohabitans]NOU80786.1 GNAT family N-acetyltransferase [Paenibacillus phytohabitans]
MKTTLTVRKLSIDEADKVYALMCRVTKLPSSQYYSPSDIDYYKSRIEDYGAIFGAFCNNELVAYAVLDFPGIGSDNFGTLTGAGIPQNELLRVALMAGCIVEPGYRGQGIQIELCKEREKYAKSLGCLHLYSTIHPLNNYSLQNVLESGFKIIFENVKLDWGVRNILYKRIF